MESNASERVTAIFPANDRMQRGRITANHHRLLLLLAHISKIADE